MWEDKHIIWQFCSAQMNIEDKGIHRISQKKGENEALSCNLWLKISACFLAHHLITGLVRLYEFC